MAEVRKPLTLFEDLALTAKETAFASEYVLDQNPTQAAIRTGHPAETASMQGAEYLTRTLVKAAVDRLEAQREVRVGMTPDTVLNEMGLLALSTLDHYYIDDEGQVQLREGAPEGAMAAVQSIRKKTKYFLDHRGEVVGREHDVEIKLWNKTEPLKLMGKHVGLQWDRVEVTGKGGGPVVTQVIREIAEASAINGNGHHPEVTVEQVLPALEE
jgi:phage terminase small subunit